MNTKNARISFLQVVSAIVNTGDSKSTGFQDRVDALFKKFISGAPEPIQDELTTQEFDKIFGKEYCLKVSGGDWLVDLKVEEIIAIINTIEHNERVRVFLEKYLHKKFSEWPEDQIETFLVGKSEIIDGIGSESEAKIEAAAQEIFEVKPEIKRIVIKKPETEIVSLLLIFVVMNFDFFSAIDSNFCFSYIKQKRKAESNIKKLSLANAISAFINSGSGTSVDHQKNRAIALYSLLFHKRPPAHWIQNFNALESGSFHELFGDDFRLEIRSGHFYVMFSGPTIIDFIKLNNERDRLRKFLKIVFGDSLKGWSDEEINACLQDKVLTLISLYHHNKKPKAVASAMLGMYKNGFVKPKLCINLADAINALINLENLPNRVETLYKQIFGQPPTGTAVGTVIEIEEQQFTDLFGESFELGMKKLNGKYSLTTSMIFLIVKQDDKCNRVREFLKLIFRSEFEGWTDKDIHDFIEPKIPFMVESTHGGGKNGGAARVVLWHSELTNRPKKENVSEIFYFRNKLPPRPMLEYGYVHEWHSKSQNTFWRNVNFLSVAVSV